MPESIVFAAPELEDSFPRPHEGGGTAQSRVWPWQVLGYVRRQVAERMGEQDGRKRCRGVWPGVPGAMGGGGAPGVPYSSSSFPLSLLSLRKMGIWVTTRQNVWWQ